MQALRPGRREDVLVDVDEIYEELEKRSMVIIEFVSQAMGVKMNDHERLVVEVGIQAGMTAAMEWTSENFDLVPKVDSAG
jgi:hypothetical protein